jgi:serine/threonine protein kinase
MPEPSETPSEVEGALLGRIADEVAEQLRRGETPDLADYALRYPHLSRLIVEGLPLLELIRHRPAGSPAGPARREPEQLGEFRIVRLIGRGGMAAVYEAEQAALGRNVALKVLSASVSADDWLSSTSAAKRGPWPCSTARTSFPSSASGKRPAPISSRCSSSTAGAAAP